MTPLDRLTNAQVDAAGKAGVSLSNIVVPRSSAGILLGGAFKRHASGTWTYTGDLCEQGRVFPVHGLHLSPWACRALEAVREHLSRGT